MCAQKLNARKYNMCKNLINLSIYLNFCHIMILNFFLCVIFVKNTCVPYTASIFIAKLTSQSSLTFGSSYDLFSTWNLSCPSSKIFCIYTYFNRYLISLTLSYLKKRELFHKVIFSKWKVIVPEEIFVQHLKKYKTK